MKSTFKPVAKLAPLALAVMCAVCGNVYAQFTLSAVKAAQAPNAAALAADAAWTAAPEL